jgi:hypothetical protein
MNSSKNPGVPERLARAQQLLAALPGPYGNGHMWTLIEPAGKDSLHIQLHEFITASTRRPGTGPAHRHVPADPTELAAAIRELDATRARTAFERLTSRTLAYRTPGRYPAAKAHDVFRALGGLLAPAARWFTNADRALRGWIPVTGEVMDVLFAGTGGGILVAVLATDED